MQYYTYAYLREDKTPYYIGKGKGNRAYHKTGHKLHGINLPPSERIIILKNNLTENQALQHEIYMISIFGRKDLETGILYNKTNGGDNPPKAKPNQINRIKSIQNFWDNLSQTERKIRGNKISKTKKGKENHLPTCKVVIIELNIEFNSIKECAQYINGDPSAIVRCLNGRRQHSHKGYTFSRT
jgi:hypothetical protein